MRTQINVFWFLTISFLLFTLLSNANADGLPSPDEVTVNVIENSSKNKTEQSETDLSAKISLPDSAKKDSDDEVPVRPGYGYGDDNNQHSGPSGKSETNSGN